MPSNIIVIKAPPLDFSKTDLYTNQNKFKTLGQYIKAIPDAFFLSNKFRNEHIVHFCTKIADNPYIVTFYGPKLKYLGPSFFSAAHLLLRAKRNVFSPLSKEGRLTPGLKVQNGTFEDLLASSYKQEFNWYQILRKKEVMLPQKIGKDKSILLLFGFKAGELNVINKTTPISFGDVDVDEQVILANFYIFDRESE